MKSVGIRKEIDKLGRIYIPKELRALYGLEKEVELVPTPQGVVLRSPEYVLIRRKEIEK